MFMGLWVSIIWFYYPTRNEIFSTKCLLKFPTGARPFTSHQLDITVSNGPFRLVRYMEIAVISYQQLREVISDKGSPPDLEGS